MVPTISPGGVAAGEVGVVEVDQLGGVPELGSLDEDVVGLEVAVDDAAVMQDSQAVGDCLEQDQLVLEGEGDLGRRQAGHLDLLGDLVVGPPAEEGQGDDQVAADPGDLGQGLR